MVSPLLQGRRNEVVGESTRGGRVWRAEPMYEWFQVGAPMSLFHLASGSVSGWFGGSLVVSRWGHGMMGLRVSLSALNTDFGLIPE